MNDLIVRLAGEIRGSLRFRWYGITAAWVVALGGWGWVAMLPDVYEATARVYVDTTSLLQPLLRDQIVTPNVESQLAYVRESLLGVQSLQNVIRANALDSDIRDPRERDLLVLALRERIEIRSDPVDRNSRSNSNSIYTISYRHADRGKAIGVVRTLLETFVEDTLQQRLVGDDATGQFLDARIAEYEERLQKAEQALAHFKRQHAARLPGTQGDYFTRVQAQREALAVANRQLRMLRARRDQLVQQLTGEAPVVLDPSSAGPPPNSIDARIRDARIQLDTLLLTYTERHPDVIAARETLERLTRQREEQLAALGVSGDQEISALGANPVYQALQISLNETQAEIATLEADIAERMADIEMLQSLIDEVPEVEAELQRLNRDYNVIYDQYVELVRSRETQELTKKASVTDQIDFRIINPPASDPAPVAPPRLLLIVGVLVGALGIGGALCWVLAQIWPVFVNARMLQERLGLPVLGTVAHAWRDEQRRTRRRATVAFAVPLFGVFALFALVVAVEMAGPGLHRLIEQVVAG